MNCRINCYTWVLTNPHVLLSFSVFIQHYRRAQLQMHVHVYMENH